MTEEMRSRLLGMMMARVSRGVFPKTQREPIGYLYGHVAKEGETPTHTINGVDYVGAVLPNIDGLWTERETYAYATIAIQSESEEKYPGSPYLCTYNKPGYYRNDGIYNDGRTYTGIHVDGTYSNPVLVHTVAFSPDTLEIILNNTFESTGGLAPATMSVNGVPYDTLCWTSYDIKYENDNSAVYLAAADCVCIPVYDDIVATHTDGELYIKKAPATLNGRTLEVK